ncbi:type I secretion system permease/ATPase [Roseomonas sp. 18066]|uniref:type I secretion system permease/ATPase n=1 Tax=Roseomonas sp. 18066 TaxID=2681412 RepID=UPI00190F0D6A|nr:type I secretion system permease/ATPase [Roseomonas sp. 18066]
MSQSDAMPEPDAGEGSGLRAACMPYFVAAAVFSGAINLLYLASPLYLMQVYGRALPGRSEATLLLLTLVLLLALLVMALLDAVRARILVRAGIRMDHMLAARLLATLAARGTRREAGGGERRGEALRDLDQVRQVMTGPGVQTLFDAPWTPVYLVILAFIHPLLGAVAAAGAILLLLVALLTEFAIRRPMRRATEAASRSYAFASDVLRGSEPAVAMGMLPGLVARWQDDRFTMIGGQAIASDRHAAFSAATRFLRLSLQSLMLGVGAWLAIERAVEPAVIFAGVILMGRALAPVEQAVGAGRQITSAWESWRRLRSLFAEAPASRARMTLPRPDGRLEVRDLDYRLPGADGRQVLRDVSFAVGKGQALGIIGPSAAGKSTLARLLIGAMAPGRGSVRLGGVDLRQWDHQALGRHVGYLPQDVGLFAGTVRDNIARFGQASDEEVVTAALHADVHDMILDLPQGYDTPVGPGGAVLSGGQRQRIGLARALVGLPSLVVLDEPNAALDAEGEMALRNALEALKSQGVTFIVIAHRPNIIGAVDALLVLEDGAVSTQGPRAEVIDALRRQAVRPVEREGEAADRSRRDATGGTPS